MSSSLTTYAVDGEVNGVMVVGSSESREDRCALSFARSSESVSGSSRSGLELREEGEEE